MEAEHLRWEICEIHFRRRVFLRPNFFEAIAVGPRGEYVAGQSPTFEWAGYGPNLVSTLASGFKPTSRQARKALAALEAALFEDGWEPTADARFRRIVRAPDAARAAMPQAMTPDEVLRRANNLRDLGVEAFTQSDFDMAELHFRAALPLFQQVGDLGGEAECTKELGQLACGCGLWPAERGEPWQQIAEARDCAERALRMYERLDDLRGQADCLHRLSELDAHRGGGDAAARAAQALRLYEQVGDSVSVWGQAACLNTLGNVAFERGEDEEARRRYEQALPLWKHLRHEASEAWCHRRLGELASRARR